MIVRVAAIKQDRLLDHSLAGYLGEEIDIFLRLTGAKRDVVDA
jgi:hypothetical protein